jgi:hypothetical protein
LNKRYLDERLRDQQGFYAASDAQRSNWTAGMKEGFANWADTASDYASQSADLVNNSMSGLVGNISEALAGNKVDWEDWSKSVLASMQKIILNAMIVDSFSLPVVAGYLDRWEDCSVANLQCQVEGHLLVLTTLQHLVFSSTQKVAHMLLPALAPTVTALLDHRPILLLRKELGLWERRDRKQSCLSHVLLMVRSVFG